MSYPASGLFYTPLAAPPPAPAGPVAIVADTYEQALAYVLASPMPTPFYVVLEPRHLDGVTSVGGMAIVAEQPLSEELKAALARVLLA